MPTNAGPARAADPGPTIPTTGTHPPTDLGKLVRAGIALVGIAAAVLSFDSLRALAIACGTSERIAFLLPVAVDLAAAVSTVLWLRARGERVVQLAQWIALSTIAASVAGNGLQHYLVAESVRPAWPLVVAVGSVPAAILGAIVHLAVVATTTAPADESGSSTSAATEAATPATPAATPETSGNVPESPSGEAVLDEPLEPSSEGGGHPADDGRRDDAPTEPTPIEIVHAFLELNPGAGRRPLAEHLAKELERPVSTHEASTLKAAALAGPSLELVREGATA